MCFSNHALVSSGGREWGVGSVVVGSAFLGRPDFGFRAPESEGPKLIPL